MPILKPISGHGATGGIRRYLEKGGRALARDLFNLSYDERDAGALGDEAKEACAWDAEMDATRAAFGTDAPWRGKPARTFKHFVLSPDPGDDIDLAALRELACSWALKHFGDHEIAIVYHDDNARGIPHAHIVVNNANLRTGYRMQTQHPEDLNRDLQDMARERGLSGLSNDRAPESPSKARGRAGAGGPRSRRSVYLGRAEKEIMRSGGYSWVGDIRARVALAKTTARDEAEFLGILDALGVHVADNSAKARRDDWVFSLAEEPSKKVSGERLGFVYGKEILPLPRDEEGQPPVLPELVRVPVPHPPRRGEMAQNGKGHAPFAHDRCALPQLKVGIGPARFATLGLPFRSSASDLSFDSPERRLARISTLASRSCSFAAALGV